MAQAQATRLRPREAGLRRERQTVHGGKKHPGSVGRGSVGNLVSLAFAAEKGVPKARAARLFNLVASTSPLPPGKLRAELIPDSSWKRAGKTLGPQASQTVVRVGHVLSLAEHVWGNETDAMEWLTRPHMELRGATPFSMLKTESGGRAVEAILAALEYGFPV
jgi:putative toxin-antitoxin system antitoxin component (TIGR02293 family)